MATGPTQKSAPPARFLLSAPRLAGLPDLGLPEIALAGRSNVGKSSLLGELLKQPKLVRTSRTPGRTRALNLFLFEERLALVDLPGYGYADLPKSERARLQQMLREYLAGRDALCGVVLMLDIRREKVTDDDRYFAAAVLEHRHQLLLAVTKVDLVGRNRRKDIVRRIERDIGAPEGSAVLCSSKTGEGRSELVARLEELLRA
jgi:GTP-binding protein